MEGLWRVMIALSLNLDTGQAAQLIYPEAEPKNYNNDNYNYINWITTVLLNNYSNNIIANL